MGFNGSVVVVVVIVIVVAGSSRVIRRARVRTSVYHPAISARTASRRCSGRDKDFFCSLVMAYHSRPPVVAGVLPFSAAGGCRVAQRQPA